MEHKKHKNRLFKHFLSMPFIYMMIIPIIILDMFLFVYHLICFPLYGLPYVKRRNYVIIGRHKLEYLSLWEKFNCIYCEYANGFAGYYGVVAAETEKYWCGIKQKGHAEFNEPAHHKDFIEYGDKKAYDKYCKLGKK